jgi:hypothetical protein
MRRTSTFFLALIFTGCQFLGCPKSPTDPGNGDPPPPPPPPPLPCQIGKGTGKAGPFNLWAGVSTFILTWDSLSGDSLKVFLDGTLAAQTGFFDPNIGQVKALRVEGMGSGEHLVTVVLDSAGKKITYDLGRLVTQEPVPNTLEPGGELEVERQGQLPFRVKLPSRVPGRPIEPVRSIRFVARIRILGIGEVPPGTGGLTVGYWDPQRRFVVPLWRGQTPASLYLKSSGGAKRFYELVIPDERAQETLGALEEIYGYLDFFGGEGKLKVGVSIRDTLTVQLGRGLCK